MSQEDDSEKKHLVIYNTSRKLISTYCTTILYCTHISIIKVISFSLKPFKSTYNFFAIKLYYDFYHDNG